MWLVQLVNFVRREMNAGTKLITSAFKVKGGASGGTIHSAIGIMEDPVAKRQIANPHLLCAPETAGLDPATVSARTRPSVGLSWNNDLKSYTGPFVMSSVNEQVVRRSAYIAAQRGQRYVQCVASAAVGVLWCNCVLCHSVLAGVFFFSFPLSGAGFRWY